MGSTIEAMGDKLVEFCHTHNIRFKPEDLYEPWRSAECGTLPPDIQLRTNLDFLLTTLFWLFQMAYCLCRFADEVRQFVWNVQIPRNEQHFRAFRSGALIASAELMVYSVWLAVENWDSRWPSHTCPKEFTSRMGWDLLAIGLVKATICLGVALWMGWRIWMDGRR
jgi:hypothetical protein